MTNKPAPRESRGKDFALYPAGHMSAHLASSQSAVSQVSVIKRMSMCSDLAQSFKFPFASQLYPQTVR